VAKVYTLNGRGKLFRSEATGTDVEYRIRVVETNPASEGLGSIAGELKLLGSDSLMPFRGWERVKAFLQLQDGSWWLCSVMVDGQALNRGGFRELAPHGNPD
jgi:hypothetical protein